MAAKYDLLWRSQPDKRGEAAKVLKELIEVEASRPEPSEMLPFYQAVVLWQSGEKEEAIESQMEKIFTYPSESSDDYTVVPRLAKWLQDAGTWQDMLPIQLARYKQASADDRNIANETNTDDATKQKILRLMNRLFDNLLQDKEISAAKKLIEIHRTAGFADFERKYWSLQLFASQKDDAAVKRISEQISDQQWADATYEQSYGAMEIIFNSLMRLNDFNEATQWANKENKMMPRDTIHVGLAQIAQRDTQGLEKTLKTMNTARTRWKYKQFLGDPLAKDFVGLEEFRELRNRYPAVVPSIYDESTVYYLFESKPNESKVKEILRNQWSDQLEFMPFEDYLESGKRETTAKVDRQPNQPEVSFVAHTNRSTVVFNCSQRSLKSYDVDQPELSKLPFVVSVTRNASDDEQLSFERLNAGMLKLGCRAFYRAEESEFVIFNLDGKLDDNGNPGTQDKTSVYLYRPASEEDESYWKKMRNNCELLQEMISSDKKQDNRQWEVLVEFQRGSAVESVWMPLTDQRNAETVMTLTATRTRPIALFPDFNVGEPQSIALQEILKWRRLSKGNAD